MMTDQALSAGEGQQLRPTSAGAALSTADDVAVAADWSQVLDQAIGTVQAGLRLLLSAGVPAPEVGHELADARGRVIAESELAWIELKLVVLTEEQQEHTAIWQAHLWTVVALPAAAGVDDGAAGSEPAWVRALVAKIKTGVTA